MEPTFQGSSGQDHRWAEGPVSSFAVHPYEGDNWSLGHRLDNLEGCRLEEKRAWGRTWDTQGVRRKRQQRSVRMSRPLPSVASLVWKAVAEICLDCVKREA